MDENTKENLKKYISSLEGKIEFEKRALSNLPMPKEMHDPSHLMRDPVVRTIPAYENARRELYDLFPELKPKKQEIIETNLEEERFSGD